MNRNLSLLNITIQIPNQLVNMAFGHPVFMTHLQTLTDAEGKQIAHPTQQQTPVVPADMTPEMLDAINAQLASIGLTMSKVNG